MEPFNLNFTLPEDSSFHFSVKTCCGYSLEAPQLMTGVDPGGFSGGGGWICSNFCTYSTYLDRQAWANSVDPDQMPQNASSDQGLHCLPLTQHFYMYSQEVKWTC